MAETSLDSNESPSRDEDERGTFLGFGLLFLAALALGALGYGAYELYPRFGLPPAEGGALLGLALGAGVASFFSPCAFGLLATLLARGTDGDESASAPGSPFRFAFGLSLGAVVFVLVLGLAVGAGGATLVAGVTFTSTAGRLLRIAVGGLLLGLGLIQLDLLPNPFHRVEDWAKPLRRLSARERRERPLWGYVLFGFGYLLAGFG